MTGQFFTGQTHICRSGVVKCYGSKRLQAASAFGLQWTQARLRL